MNKSKVRGHKGNMTHFFPESLNFIVYIVQNIRARTMHDNHHQQDM